jgi:hypothetical protein
MNIKHGDKGFHITTSTGYVLSVQYGAGNYCENYRGNFGMKGEEVPEVSTVEIAIWRTDDSRMIEIDGGSQVAGHVQFSLIPHIIIDLESNNLDSVTRRLKNRS